MSPMKILCALLLSLSLIGCTSIGFHSVRYNDYLRQKISKISCRHILDYKEEGKVLMKFKLTNRGEIFDINVDEEYYKPSPEMHELALKILKEAAPFKPFPHNLMKYPNMEFKVLLSFEIRKSKK